MPVPSIEPGELLALAGELAGRRGGSGAPRTVALRRSVSTAYYAVFHAVSRHSANRLLGDAVWTPTHASVARWITHTDLAHLADAASRPGSGALRRALGVVEPRVAVLARDFVDLQSARHKADYDDYFELPTEVALTYVDAAERAVQNAVDLYRSSEPSYLRFLGLALGGVKVAKAR